MQLSVPFGGPLGKNGYNLRTSNSAFSRYHILLWPIYDLICWPKGPVIRAFRFLEHFLAINGNAGDVRLVDALHRYEACF